MPQKSNAPGADRSTSIPQDPEDELEMADDEEGVDDEDELDEDNEDADEDADVED